INMICKNDQNVGFTLLTIANSIKDLPSNCETFVSITNKDGCILGEEIETQSQVVFKLDTIPDLDLKGLSVKLSNIPILSKDESAGLPNVISFLEMYNVSKVEQLNILNRWKNNNPVVNLSTPVGVKTTGELFMLDLHEKFHGPHGLIAGSTGSGKSEFIISYILSMAVNYHPYEVQFVLIDYKGGGLAGAFENKTTGVHIPHLAGTITNLDTSEMNRTLVSIESELKRRQKIFNETKETLDESTIDIYKYQRLYREGVVKEPLAHLFIITDEFAELKSQRPEFMDQLITTARIGRSLGIHLILATQKPSGVVNDQIWSNSKFKVCLKVQDRSDSMEMLKKPDAASLKEVGRFFLQVGYDDYFDIGQSAWGGAKYVPSNRILKKVDDSITFVNNIGYTTKTINDLKESPKKEKNDNLGDQLNNTVKYIHRLAESENIKRKKMWLDIIPGFIYVNDLKVKYNYKPTQYYINPVIGEYDKPTKQEQGLLNLDITNGGNTLIYGQSGSGKEMLVSTIIWSTIAEHTPQEVNLYVIDCGAETLKVFSSIPHVGEVATVDEQEKIVNIFKMIDEELVKRRDLFADYAGSYINYCENSGSKLPLIIVVINNYDIFSEAMGRLSEAVQSIYRDCMKFGINFIITTAAAGAVRSRMAQNFNNKIALQMPNDDDYRSVIPGTPRGLIPAKFVGRGIIDKDDEKFEFQTAYIYEPSQINNAIKKAAEILNKSYTVRAKKIVVIPSVITLDLVINEVDSLENIPVGYNVETKEIHKHNFLENNINMILGNEMHDMIEFVYAITKEIKKVTSVMVVDFTNMFNTTIEGVPIYKNEFDKILSAINNQVMNDATSTSKTVYVMTGIGSFITKSNPHTKAILNSIFNAASSLKNNIFIFVDNYATYKNMQLESWYSTQVNNSSGIWLGDGIGAQIAINANNIDADIRKQNFAYMGFAINKGKLTSIKCVVDMEGQNEK
ncbi:MAG: type VII secretion protein EssC, partial [Bacilli bacterium]|nr:type VII secretion protein EssC [Bacilli bacterium]